MYIKLLYHKVMVRKILLSARRIPCDRHSNGYKLVFIDEQAAGIISSTRLSTHLRAI